MIWATYLMEYFSPGKTVSPVQVTRLVEVMSVTSAAEPIVEVIVEVR